MPISLLCDYSPPRDRPLPASTVCPCILPSTRTSITAIVAGMLILFMQEIYLIKPNEVRLFVLVINIKIY
jgi:hypothetical protein